MSKKMSFLPIQTPKRSKIPEKKADKSSEKPEIIPFGEIGCLFR